MEMLIAQLTTYGTMPALLVLTSVVGLLIKKIGANSKKDAARSEAVQKSILALEASMEKRFCEQSDRMSAIERDYLPRETHYKDIGGWRSDISQLRSDVGEDLRAIRAEMSTTNTNLIATVLKGANNGS
jgi:hypothetical protein